MDATGFGHGKVILLGEHAVVHGHPALAAGLEAGVRAIVRSDGRTDGGRLRVPAWSLDMSLHDPDKPALAVRAIVETLIATGHPLPALENIVIEVHADIPAAAGLGSSAAFATAVARALAAHTTIADPPITTAVNAAERIFHGNPSGIDAAAAATGGFGIFTRDNGWQSIGARQPMDLCVGLSGRPRDTETMVTIVQALRARTPAAAQLLGVLGDLTHAGVTALDRGDIDELGRLFDLAHGILAGLRVSTPELDAMVHAARSAGALGAKLTGAGGGGAVIALAPGHERDVLERWRRDGFTGFMTRIGQVAP